jgi:hypothetical protein
MTDKTERPARATPIWSVAEADDVLYVVRSGVWEARVRISPVLRGEDRDRAREVCDALNRLAG